MNFLERLERMHRIHKLIQMETTGSPAEFAERLHLRERQLYNILDELKNYGAEIKFDLVKYSYYYTCNFEFSVKIGEIFR
ncbi:MAG: hypothetical protein LBN18_08580 [Dysgonamonadaceae bacterium]|jgi:predicted DNA-binding transcriptional regulator YafY|nr:hypothetical protein [Dysgonamonadaceae bacterium]